MTRLPDASVANVVRAQGQGYQGRINRVLGTYAQMRIADVRMAEERIRRSLEEYEAEQTLTVKRT